MLFDWRDNDRIGSLRLEDLSRLPDTAEEVREIAVSAGGDPKRDVFLGLEASEDRVKTMGLSDRRVIVFASHALVPGDLDGLRQPAVALSSPEVTGGGEDGLLTMEEILRLELDADWASSRPATPVQPAVPAQRPSPAWDGHSSMPEPGRFWSACGPWRPRPPGR